MKGGYECNEQQHGTAEKESHSRLKVGWAAA